MNYQAELPDSRHERAQMLMNVCIQAGTYGPKPEDDQIYKHLRAEFVRDDSIRDVVPSFLRTCRDQSHLRSHIQQHGGYAQRRDYIRSAFQRLLDRTEGREGSPADKPVGEALESFDPDAVHAVWAKALSRRESDPDGAITSARTLLETVCKQLLDRASQPYNEKDDLPALYGKVAKVLNLAPSQHTEESFRAILGGAHQIVERLGSLRNQISDAHGRGGRPIKPAARHAQLAVNLAGAIAMFLVETWLARQK